MAALKVIGIILLVFLLLGFLRIGALVSFGDELCVRLRVGWIKLTVLPKKEKAGKPKKKKPKAEEAQASAKAGKKKKPRKKRGMPKPTLEELLDLVQTALAALGAMLRRTCRRVRIDPLDLTIILAGANDPSSAAMAYGAASSAMFTIMPKLEERFYIPDPSLHLRVDFTSDTLTAKGQAGVSLRLCDLFAIVFTLIIPLFQWFLRLKKAHRHDAPPAHKGAPGTPAEPSDNGTAENKNEDTEDKIA